MILKKRILQTRGVDMNIIIEKITMTGEKVRRPIKTEFFVQTINFIGQIGAAITPKEEGVEKKSVMKL